jgi:DNA adenine methylase
MSAFDEGDHVALSTCLADCAEARWLLTYDNVPRAADLYPDFAARW